MSVILHPPRPRVAAHRKPGPATGRRWCETFENVTVAAPSTCQVGLAGCNLAAGAWAKSKSPVCSICQGARGARTGTESLLTLSAGGERIRTFGSATRSHRRQRDLGVTPPDPTGWLSPFSAHAGSELIQNIAQGGGCCEDHTLPRRLAVGACGLRRRGLGQFEPALCDGSSRGFRFARDLHSWEGEFDAVLVERLLDHRIGLSPDHELLARDGHHLRSDRHRVIAELIDALHLQ